MNVYDFDGTIYPTDCSIDFFFWCMKGHPKLWVTYFPKTIRNLVLRKMGKMTEATMQREFFGYLTPKVKKKIDTGWNSYVKED